MECSVETSKTYRWFDLGDGGVVRTKTVGESPVGGNMSKTIIAVMMGEGK
jgi:hypothetical protein